MGNMIPDHIPLMDDDRRVGTAYSIGHMQALVERANAACGVACSTDGAESR